MEDDWTLLQSTVEPGTVIVTNSGAGGLEQALLDGRHALLADEPVAAGGADSGPSPYELLLMALGACTSMTLRLYAEHKQLPLEHVLVRLRHRRNHVEDSRDCAEKGVMLDQIDRTIELVGPLDAAQRQRLLEIAERCPVHRTLSQRVVIETRLVDG
jgi:putative redox protein